MMSVAESEASAIDIGKYRVVAELAKGGMGNVYLAIARGPGGFNKLLAVKELKPSFCDDETYVAMFLEEARLAARLTHPNIVQTNEVGSDGNRHFMIMEFLDGRSLYRIGRHLARHDGLPVGAHLRVITEALHGLHYAHELRGFDGESLEIVHRDVSPLNVVVTFDGQAKVLDFGIAKSVDSALETRAGVLKGRIAYMSPEQACGGKVDRRADVYSAGVMVWEAAAGQRLWPHMSDVEILSHLLRDGPPSLRAACPNASPELDAICARAMARHVNDRYPTAAALGEALEAHLAGRADTMSMREIGARITRSFHAERDKTSLLIEEAVSRVRESRPSGTLPSLRSPVSGTISASASRSVVAEVPSLFPGSPSSDPSLKIEGSAAGRGLSDSNSSGAIEAPRARAQIPWIVGTGAACGVSLVLAAALAVAVAHRGGQSSPAPTERKVSTSTSVPRPAAEPAFVTLAVRVSPSTAQIVLDGTRVAGNPFSARFTKDGQPHRIVASAEGYEAKTEEVSLANDVAVDISLDRLASATRQVVTRWIPSPAAPARGTKGPTPDSPRPSPALELSPQPTPVATRNEFDPAGGRPPLRPIVTHNPYGPQ
jgi:serine/threonine-protein kinase